MHRQNDQGDQGKMNSQVFHQLQSGRRFEGNIEQSQVGPGQANSGERLRSIFRFSSNGQIILLVNQIGQTLSYERMIIDNKDAAFATCFFGGFLIHKLVNRVR
jgi:hypothetical protein